MGYKTSRIVVTEFNRRYCAVLIRILSINGRLAIAVCRATLALVVKSDLNFLLHSPLWVRSVIIV